MELDLQKYTELCRDPMLGVAKGRIALMNTAARRLFPALSVGDEALSVLPAHLLQYPANAFLSSAMLNDMPFTVSGLLSGETLLLALAAEEKPADCMLVSDALISGMLSALYNIELAANHLRSTLPQDDASETDCLSILYHNYYMLCHKLSNLNAMRQLQEQAMRLVPRRVDLVELCRSLVHSVNRLTGPTLAKLEFSCALDTLVAFVDAPKVERILVNLLSNALKYTPQTGSIRLRLSKSGENAVFSVDDTGCGIRSELLNSVFHAYDRRNAAQDLRDMGTGGFGLGLSRALAELHGGVLILESRAGEGTSVRAMLPLSPPDENLFTSIPVYETQGMSFLLLELCDVLDRSVYRVEYLD